jgi:hypothetical protein
VRIKAGDEWITTFRCKFGSFEYNVIPFGLTNTPAAFQSFMNDIFADVLDEFVVVYLDDILIYSDDPSKHDDHVRLMLERLIQHGLVERPEKCSFDLTEIDFLGHIISVDGIRMDPAKVTHHFIQSFSDLTFSLTRLLLKDVPFVWTSTCTTAFDTLKLAFTSFPVLRHYDFQCTCTMETDASDFAISSVLSQDDEQGHLHPIVFYSRQLLPAEINYNVGDKELLAIVEGFKHFRHYAISVPAASPVTVLSDHKKLECFSSLSKLSCHQFRWAEILADFNFRICFRAGRLCANADALSRRPDYELNDDSPHVTQMNRQVFVPDGSAIRLTPAVMSSAIELTTTSSLLDCFRAASQGLITDVLGDPDFTIHDGLVFHNELLVPPMKDLRVEVISHCHDAPLAGHFGVVKKTCELVNRNFWWPGYRHMIKSYIAGCDACLRAKPSCHKPFGLLHPLPVPDAPWTCISLDFITDLPSILDLDSIFVFKDRFSKMAHFIPCSKAIDACQTADLFIKEIFCLHEFPKSIVSDRGPQFVSHFWRHLLSRLGVSVDLSSAHHPEADGSTEVVNQILE